VHSFFINSTLGSDKKLETHIQCIFCFGTRDIIDKIQMAVLRNYKITVKAAKPR